MYGTQSSTPLHFAYPDLLAVYLKKKADAWALQNWVHEAQARAEEYYKRGPQSPVTWVLTYRKNILPGAIEGGYDKGHTVFIARAYQDVSFIVSCTII